jgi:hypothetical protein
MGKSEMAEIRAWVKDVGAPLAAAAFLGWLVVRLGDQSRIDRAEELKAHATEIQQVVDAFKACCLKRLAPEGG